MTPRFIVIALCTATFLVATGDIAGADDTVTRPIVRLSAHAGISSSTLATEADAAIDAPVHRTAGQFGVGARVVFDDAFALRLGLSYSALGARAEIDSDAWGVPRGTLSTIELSYLDIEALAMAQIPGRHRVSTFFAAGPAFGILWNAAAVSDRPGDDSLEETLEPVDLAGVLATGIDVDLSGRARLTVRASYRHGFTNIERINMTDGQVDGALRNRSFSLTTGVSF